VPLVLSGRVVPLTRKTSIAPGESASFPGRVYLADNGTITAVTKAGAAPPAGFSGAPVVDVGSALILPGFIDLHSHIAYATLPVSFVSLQPVSQ
jgi:5-methylthioadenosine/S-adenosylhomocysteine deaminase